MVSTTDTVQGCCKEPLEQSLVLLPFSYQHTDSILGDNTSKGLRSGHALPFMDVSPPWSVPDLSSLLMLFLSVARPLFSHLISMMWNSPTAWHSAVEKIFNTTTAELSLRCTLPKVWSDLSHSRCLPSCFIAHSSSVNQEAEWLSWGLIEIISSTALAIFPFQRSIRSV